MNVKLFLTDGAGISFQEVPRQSYRGNLMPGSQVFESKHEAGIITIQESVRPFFLISQRLFKMFKRVRLLLKESGGLRLEALLSGEITIVVNNKTKRLKAGDYHITDVPFFTALFKRRTSCQIFVTYYSTELLDEFGITLAPTIPSKMPEEMSHLIRQMIDNTYAEGLRDHFYEDSVRELLFFHLAQNKIKLPGRLDNIDIAAIYRADKIISANVSEHISIERLSRMAGTNAFKLKKGFRQLFGMGVFHRLLHLRMVKAIKLLETTDRSIGEIADLAGYETAAGFIHAFRREYGMTPREWRLKHKSASYNENYDR